MNVVVRIWTPERVEERLTDALRIVVKSQAGRVGPRAPGSGWQEIEREFEDYVGIEVLTDARGVKTRVSSLDRLLEKIEAMPPKFSVAEMTDADEALTWPARFLAEAPLARDAIWIVTLGRALGANVDKILAKRRAAADAMIDRRKWECPDIIRIYEDDARDVAEKWVARANDAMAKPLTAEEIERLCTAKLRRLREAAEPKKAKKLKIADVSLSAEEIAGAVKRRNDRIRSGIAIQFRKDAKRAGCVERIAQLRITRQDVMPGRHFNPRHLYNAYNSALEAIASGLAWHIVAMS